MRVQLAVPWTDDKGVEHRAGSKVQVVPEVGRQLILDGHAAAAGVDASPEPDADPGEKTAEPEPSGTKPAHQPATTSPNKGDTEKGAGHGGSQL